MGEVLVCCNFFYQKKQDSFAFVSWVQLYLAKL